MDKSKEDVANYYDSFSAKQLNLGISVRHRLIFKKLKSIGLKSDSKVLEIGCGIGTVSKLIIEFIKKGKFVGCDISPESIDLAKRMNKQSNAEFICSDMDEFTHDLKFDFFVFPDVLEHIPQEEHKKLFLTISKLSKPESKVLINIPEPDALNWFRQNKPELLQIIDQSLSIRDLINDVYDAGFKVESIIPYNIGTYQNNYLSLVLYRERDIHEIKYRSKWVNFIQNWKARL